MIMLEWILYFCPEAGRIVIGAPILLRRGSGSECLPCSPKDSGMGMGIRKVLDDFSGITWVLVYRTDKYKRLKAEVEKQSKKLEKKKETITESAGRQQKKKIERQEEKLKNNNRDLSMVRMKSMFAIGFCFTALMGMFNSIFDGRVVAKLPFIPLSYIQGLSHRNLLGEDCTDCSFIFLYILCTMSIRQNIQKLLGLAPSRAATKQAGGFLGPPPQAGKFS
ncbi:calcium load-activated calcium channel isoform X1 [Pantherophis guttatus]|uniref:Calcium load-activated calcium channel n=2 Tax=Colubroidea TaxID=34989 RepID=A0ABM3ZCS6_PANGU|nr:calcium load-activated calcium channel isoform X1 [Pantherophis guttatus]